MARGTRGSRPIQYIDAKGHVIPYNPSDNTSKIVYLSDLYRIYGSTRPGTAVTTAGWRISKETVDTSGNTTDIQFYNGDNDFNNVWNSGTTLNISGASKASPCVVTVSSTSTLSSNDIVYIASVGGMTQINSHHYKITVINSTTFSLQDPDNDANIDSSAYTTYTSGGTANKVEYGNPTSWA